LRLLRTRSPVLSRKSPAIDLVLGEREIFSSIDVEESLFCGVAVNDCRAQPFDDPVERAFFRLAYQRFEVWQNARRPRAENGLQPPARPQDRALMPGQSSGKRLDNGFRKKRHIYRCCNEAPIRGLRRQTAQGAQQAPDWTKRASVCAARIPDKSEPGDIGPGRLYRRRDDQRPARSRQLAGNNAMQRDAAKFEACLVDPAEPAALPAGQQNAEIYHRPGTSAV
jgi:hypothetical protein